MTEAGTKFTLTTNADILWRITLDGEPLELRPADVTVAQAAALRQQSHGAWRWPTLMAALDEAIGPEELAGMVFVARRQAGEDTTYDAVAAQIEGSSEVLLDFDPDPTSDADPEA